MPGRPFSRRSAGARREAEEGIGDLIAAMLDGHGASVARREILVNQGNGKDALSLPPCSRSARTHQARFRHKTENTPRQRIPFCAN